MKQALTAAAFAAAIVGAGIAHAANATGPQRGPPPASAAPVIADADAMRAADQLNHAPLAQMLKDELAKAGLTDISVASASFIVHAKTQAGKPVTLVVGPDGVTEIVKVTAPVAAEQSH